MNMNALRAAATTVADHLRPQWAEAAAKVGIALDPTLPNSVGPVRPDVTLT